MVCYQFKEAFPVWEKDKDKTMNYHLVFRSVVPASEECKIALSASNMYQMFINGEMIAEGPARAGHGYYRVDEIDISPFLSKEENIVSLYVAGYYIENFYLIKQPSFLCAEVISEGKVIAATGKTGFVAKYNNERMRKVARFSYQRTFSEYYVVNGENKSFDTDINAVFKAVELVKVEDKIFIERGVPYPCYDVIAACEMVSKGNVVFGDVPNDPNRKRFIDFTPDCKGFTLDEVEYLNTDIIEKGIYTKKADLTGGFSEVVLGSNEYAVCRFKGINTGFIKLEVESSSNSEMMVVFDEIDVDGDVDTHRVRETQQSVIWSIPKGKHELVSNEPYVVHFLKIINKSSSTLKVKNISLINYTFDYTPAPLNSGNDNLDRIYLAAVNSFKQNVLDIYMDCASRERAGWLCDSFFTARVEKLLTGKSVVERNFLENFLMCDNYENLDEGMLPMCYPSDFLTNDYIPNWAMWYVLELEEYFLRTGDKEFLEFSKEKVLNLVGFFEKYENEDGLLEKLPSWVFVEWSKANEFVQDVNYPSNMLYAKMLQIVSRLYDEKYASKAEKIMEEINRQSFFDGFYHDHAVRNSNGVLEVLKDDITETCQYYAFHMGCATKDSRPELWKILVDDFGPFRDNDGKWGHIYPSNAFIGNYLRLDILSRENMNDKVLKDIEGFFSHMAEQTETLWELQRATGSCCHGFASHVAVWLRKIYG